jgi:hypothetical protein
MRLGQLSRKINIKSTDIVEFIEKEFNDTIKNHPNCKVPDEYLTSIQSNFLIEDIEDSTHEEEESLDERKNKAWSLGSDDESTKEDKDDNFKEDDSSIQKPKVEPKKEEKISPDNDEDDELSVPAFIRKKMK